MGVEVEDDQADADHAHTGPEGANLVNSDGLPSFIFRTDDWVDVIPKEEAVTPQVNAQAEPRKLAARIQQLAAKRNRLERGSEDHKRPSAELLGLRKKLKVGAEKK